MKDATRVVHAGLPAAADGTPFLPGPVFAAPFHLAGPADASPYGYARYANPTWSAYESALAELEGGEAVVFASGMAATAALLQVLLAPGSVLVAPSDGYYNLRPLASDHLREVEVRFVPTDDAAIRDAAGGATVVWVESPSNPGLDVVDVAALARDLDALVVVDNTLATPLRQRPLELGADVSLVSASKHMTGHSDLVLGYAALRDPELAGRLRSFRGTTGAIPGPFEVWLAHRSLATLAVRLERQEATAAALTAALRERVDDVRWPGFGSVVCFDLETEEAAHAFFSRTSLVAEATSFGGVHSSAEARGRWGTDAVGPGFIRFSVGIEDPDDLLQDVLSSLP